MSDSEQQQGPQRSTILLIAVPSLLWFPFAFSLVVVAGDQLLFGFDDFPILTIAVSLAIGAVGGLSALIFVLAGVRRRSQRWPFRIAVAALVFGVLALPAARLLTKLEEDRRYGKPPPPNHALQPTAAPPSVPQVTAVRERTVRSTVTPGRLWLSLGR